MTDFFCCNTICELIDVFESDNFFFLIDSNMAEEPRDWTPIICVLGEILLEIELIPLISPPPPIATKI